MVSPDVRRIERMLFNCPDLDCDDYVDFPGIDDDSFMTMESDYLSDTSTVHMFSFVREKDNGDGYVELYVWDGTIYPVSYRRFVIAPGYRMNADDENDFFDYLSHNKFCFTDKQMSNLYKKIINVFPEWHFLEYEDSEVLIAFEHIYFASHYSGPREILYKAGLWRYAHFIERIPEYNLIGRTAQSILHIDAPNKLLKIINGMFFVFFECLEDDNINLYKEVYKKYSSYIGKDIPSEGQWQYLVLLYKGDNSPLTRHGFDRTIYNRLADSYGYSLYIFDQILELREQMPELRKMKFPKVDDVEDVSETIESIKYYSGNIILNRMIYGRYNNSDYEYRDEKYSVVMPQKAYDICCEALNQGNCLMGGYIEQHAEGKTNILFLRKTDSIEESFVTLEIKENNINCVYGHFNSVPCKDVFVFLEKYSDEKKIKYQPDELIADYRWDLENSDYRDEVKEYLEEYKMKTTTTY